MKKETLTVSVTLVPAKGVEVVKTVQVPATTASNVGEVAKALGVDLDKKNLMVDGKPATADTPVTAASAIRVSERPKGS